MTNHTPLVRSRFSFILHEHHSLLKRSLSGLFTAATNYNCERLLRIMTKPASMSLPPFIPMMTGAVSMHTPLALIANISDSREALP